MKSLLLSWQERDLAPLLPWSPLGLGGIRAQQHGQSRSSLQPPKGRAASPTVSRVAGRWACALFVLGGDSISIASQWPGRRKCEPTCVPAVQCWPLGMHRLCPVRAGVRSMEAKALPALGQFLVKRKLSGYVPFSCLSSLPIGIPLLLQGAWSHCNWPCCGCT